MVTHPSTNLPVSCLSTAERTGSADFMILWSYVEGWDKSVIYHAVVNELATIS